MAVPKWNSEGRLLPRHGIKGRRVRGPRCWAETFPGLGFQDIKIEETICTYAAMDAFGRH